MTKISQSCTFRASESQQLSQKYIWQFHKIGFTTRYSRIWRIGVLVVTKFRCMIRRRRLRVFHALTLASHFYVRVCARAVWMRDSSDVRITRKTNRSENGRIWRTAPRLYEPVSIQMQWDCACVSARRMSAVKATDRTRTNHTRMTSHRCFHAKMNYWVSSITFIYGAVDWIEDDQKIDNANCVATQFPVESHGLFVNVPKKKNGEMRMMRIGGTHTETWLFAIRWNSFDFSKFQWRIHRRRLIAITVKSIEFSFTDKI